MANDDRVVELLQEIRDLSRQHVENYKDALRNQRESIEMYRVWERRASRRSVIVVVVAVLAVVLAEFVRHW